MSEQEMWLALPSVEKEEKAELLISLARAASCRGSHGQSLELAQAALKVYEAMGAAASGVEIAGCHWGMGFALKALHQADEALEEIDKAIALYRECNYPFLDDVLRTRATWCSEMMDWDGTLAAHLEAIQLNEIEGNTEWEARSYLNAGYAYIHMKKFHEALIAFQTARTKFAEVKMVPDVARADRWIADAYSEIGEAKLAYGHARKSMNVAELMQERLPIMFSEFALGKALLVGGELLDESETHLNLAYTQAISVGANEMDWEFIIKVQRERIKLLKLQDRGPEAEEIEKKIATVTEVIE